MSEGHGREAGERRTDARISEHLFVYGSLRRDAGHAMHRVLARDASLVGEGSVAGRIYDLGPYPGAVPFSDGSRVHGEVYRLHRPASTLAKLDRYEGCGPLDDPPHRFERAHGHVRLDSGETLTAWVYWYRGSWSADRRIDSGDFLRPGRGAAESKLARRSPRGSRTALRSD